MMIDGVTVGRGVDAGNDGETKGVVLGRTKMNTSNLLDVKDELTCYPRHSQRWSRCRAQSSDSIPRRSRQA